MTRLFTAILAAVLFLAGGAGAATFETGLEAAKKGEYAAALEAWRPLAAKGHTEAQYHLGLMYRHGRGVSRDYEEAAKWFRLSADKGYMESEYALATLFVAGKGVGRDYKKAFALFEKAAAQGSPAAKNNLAHMYRYGKGVRKSIGRALIWYQKAIADGYPPALDAMGRLYANGQYVPKDNVEAFKWLFLAKNFGSTGGARYLKYVTKKLNDAQVKQATKMAHEWIAAFRARKQN